MFVAEELVLGFDAGPLKKLVECTRTYSSLVELAETLEMEPLIGADFPLI
jgi:hypothetical protein